MHDTNGSSSYSSLADLARGLAQRGTATALTVFRDDGAAHLSCAQLAEDIDRLAAGLIAQGLARGEAVLLCAPNSAAWVTAYFAVLCAGGLVVPLDDQSTAEDLSRVLADSGARRIFTSQAHAGELAATAAAKGPDVILLDDAPETPGTKTWRQLLAARQAAPPQIAPDDPACLLYTSGTTGTPKAVPLTHRNILSNVEALLAARLAGPRDRVLLPLPLHHAYPCTVGLLGSLASGATLVLPAGISGPQILAALQAARVTILIGVPRLYTALLAAIEAQVQKANPLARAAFRALLALSRALRPYLGVGLGRLLFAGLHRRLAPQLRLLGCGGAQLDAAAGEMLEALGWEVLTGYGLTETSPLLTFARPGRSRPATAGSLLPGVELRIVPQADRDAGEIQARGPSVFTGYRNNPEATRQAFTADGWFRSGDLGFLDGDGYLHIVGRAKEIIVLPDGKNVQPEDVEAAYAASPLIREAAVIEQEGVLVGLLVPDAEALRARGAASAANLLRGAIEEVSHRLPSHQRLAGYRLTQEKLPRTPLGKLRRHLLAPLYARAEGGPPREAAALSEADRALLAAEPAAQVWRWLGERFPDSPLSLDTSPQLDLRIDSLAWVELSLDLEDRFDITLAGEDIARIVTLRDFLQAVQEATGKPAEAAGRAVTASDAAADEARWLRPPGPLLALLGRLAYALNRLVIRAFFRLRVAGAEQLPPHGPYVVTPNHASYLDPLVIAAALPSALLREVHWAGWTGVMFAGPFSRLLSRIARVIPVDPDRAPARGLELGKAVLRRGGILVWFPEGGRSPDGRLAAFHPGIGRLLQESGAAAVPTLIRGSFEALPRGRRWPRRRAITVAFAAPARGAALEGRGQGAETAARITDGLRSSLTDLDAPTEAA